MDDSLPIIKPLLRICAVMLLPAGVVTAAGETSQGEAAAGPGVVMAVDAVVDAASAGAANSATSAELTLRDWADTFYLQRPLCGASEIRDVSIQKDNVLVRLDIEPEWEQALSKLDEADAGRWFAIHCPLPVATAGPALGNRDITIVSTNADNPHTRFSCREFERSLRLEAEARKAGFRERFNALLQRIGVDSP